MRDLMQVFEVKRVTNSDMYAYRNELYWYCRGYEDGLYDGIHGAVHRQHFAIIAKMHGYIDGYKKAARKRQRREDA